MQKGYRLGSKNDVLVGQKPKDRARDIEIALDSIFKVPWIGSVTRKWKISVAAMMFQSGS